MARESKDTMWNVRLGASFIARLNKTAEVLDVPAAQIAREGIAEKIEKLAKKNRRLAEALDELAA